MWWPTPVIQRLGPGDREHQGYLGDTVKPDPVSKKREESHQEGPVSLGSKFFDSSSPSHIPREEFWQGRGPGTLEGASSHLQASVHTAGLTATPWF